MENKLEVIIEAQIKQLKTELKEAEKKLKEFSDTAEDAGEGTKKIDESFKGIKKNSAVFQKINESTGGIAGNTVDIINGFKGAKTSVDLFKVAIASTGIGLLVVAVGALAVYWDDITDFVTGVNRELARQREEQEKIVDAAQQQVDLVQAQLNTLKLSGKTEKEINSLKREKLLLLLKEKQGVLDVARTQLEQLVKSEKASKDVILRFTALGRAAQLQLAKTFDSIFGTNFAADVKSIQDSVIDFIAGTDSEEAQKEFNALTLELIKLQDQIDKTKLDDIKIDKKTSENVAKEAAKLLKIFEKIDKDLELLELEKIQQNANDVEKIYEESGARIANALKLPVDEFDFGLGDGIEAVKAFEKKLEDVRKLLNDPDFNFDKVLSSDEVNNFAKELKIATDEVLIVKNIATNAISSIGSSLSESLRTDNALFNAFTSAIISTGQTLLQELATQAIAGLALKKTEAVATVGIEKAKATSSAVAAGAASASSAGPLGAFLLPALIGAAIGFVAAAFSGIKFAQGGIVPGGNFTGDRVPALLNSGEMVLNRQQQSNLFSLLNGNMRKNSNNGQPTVEVQGVIRGSDILLSSTRASKENKRFNIN